MEELSPYVWIAQPNGVNALPEFQQALVEISIEPSIMETSRLKQVIVKLMQEYVHLIEGRDFGNDLFEAIKFAFSVPLGATQQQAHRMMVNVPEYYNGSISALHNDILYLYSHNYTWEREYMHLAIRILTERKNIGLSLSLGLLQRGKRECDARRRMAFSSLMLAASEYVMSKPADLVTVSNTEAAKRRIHEFCFAEIEQYKEEAFRSTFIEPSVLFFTLIGDEIAAGDVDVHGSNTYLALLQASTGISIPRIALLQDDFKGICQFLDVNFPKQIVQKLFDPNNIGKRAGYYMKEIMKERLLDEAKLRARQSNVRNGIFLFNGNFNRHRNAEQLANAAIDPSGNQTAREQFAKYLMIYASYFKPEYILKTLYRRLTDESRYEQDVKIIFESLKEEDMMTNVHDKAFPCGYHISPDCTTINQWLWSTTDDIGYEFNHVGAQRFFAACGVAKAV